MFKLEETPEEREYLVKFNFITEKDFTAHFSDHEMRTEDFFIRPIRFDFTPDFVRMINHWDEFISIEEKDYFFHDLLLNHNEKSYITFQKVEIPKTFWNNTDNINEFVRVELLKLNNIIEKKIQKYNQSRFDELYYYRFIKLMGIRDADYNLIEIRESVDKLYRKSQKLYIEFSSYKDDESEFNFVMAKREYDIALEKLQIKRIEGELSMLIEEEQHHNLYYAFLEKKRFELEKNVSEK